MFDPNKDLSGLPDPIQDAQFYAGVPVKRFVAWIIDVCIVLAVSLGFIVVTLGIGALVAPIFMFSFNLAYRIYFLTKQSATPGMRLCGIEIRNNLGERLGFEQAVWHTGVFTFAFMFFFTNMISIVMMLVGQRGQGLHDYVLGTTAVNRPVDN